jgi:TIR domain
MGKQVFSADPKTLEIAPHSGSALDLAAFASYQREDAAQVRQITDFLNRERHFDLWLDIQNLQMGAHWAAEIEQSFEDRLKRGGYAVVFWFRCASRSEFVNSEIERAARGISGVEMRIFNASHFYRKIGT